MKQLLLIVSLSWLISHITYSQDKGFQLGVKVLPGFSDFNNLHFQGEAEPVFVVNGGIMLIKDISKSISVETGIYYVNKASNIKTTIFDNPIIFKTAYHYITIPVLGRLNLHDNFYLSAGPAVDFYVNGYNDTFSYRTPLDEQITRVGVGYQINTGYQRKINEQLRFFLEAGIRPMFTSIYQDWDLKAINYGGGFGIQKLFGN